MAKQLRLRLERILPQNIGKLAARLQESRESLRARFPDGSDRRNALDAALGEGGMLDPLDAGSADRVDEWLKGADQSEGTRTVEITLTSDDPEDLTLKQLRLLGTVDTLIHDPDVPAAILDRSRADALRRELPYSGEYPDGLTVVLKRG